MSEWLTHTLPVPTQPMDRVLILRQRDDRLFWPYDFVARLSDEGTGRVEATSADGEVAHLMGTLSELEGPPWVKVMPGLLVHPAYARRRGRDLHLPGGWRIPFTGRLPRSAPTADPLLPGTTLRRDEILEIVRRGKRSYWVTDRGEIPCDGSEVEAAVLHGDIVHIGWRYVNRRRVRRLIASVEPRVLLDNGTEIGFSVGHGTEAVRVALGLPARKAEEPLSRFHESLFALELRDYPFELFTAPAETLHALFHGDAHLLLEHLLWQTVRYRRQGQTLTYGRTNRGYWYRPVLPAVTRAGHVKGVELHRHVDGDVGRRYDATSLYTLYQMVLLRMIGLYRVMTYADLGFDDSRPDLRGIGAAHAEVVLIAEKESVGPFVRRLAQHSGVSYVILTGQPTLLETECFVRDLRKAYGGKVRVVAYVDYDYAGWIIADAFVHQLARYDVETTRLDHLVTPDRFTDPELRMFSHPLTATRRTERTKIRVWMDRTQGIHGKARGIYSNHLLPYERVERAFGEVTGL